jgi:hypothetical protein
MGRADSSFEVALNAEVLPHLPVSLREAASFDKRGNIWSRNRRGASSPLRIGAESRAEQGLRQIETGTLPVTIEPN